MLSFHRAAEADFLAVNEMIVEQLHSDVELVENIGHYIIEGGGKRLRPLVVLLSALACNYDGKNHIQLAGIIEFIHTATLLHDDVVDTSELRRGRPTANTKWGNSPPVLVGDFLYSRAFQLLVALGSMDIMRVLSDTTNTIAEGEVQQLLNAGDANVSEQSYLEVIYKKTAILFEAATHTGSLLAGADSKTIENFALYGKHLGMAFQLQDDALDYLGNEEDLGKNVGDDLAEGKPTLPLIYTIREGDSSSASLVREAIESNDLNKIDDVVRAVNACGGLDYTKNIAAQHAEKAASALIDLPDSSYKKALIDLTVFAIERNH